MEPVAINTLFKTAARVALATAIILLLPFLAMQFTAEVVWNLADFVVAGGLLFAGSAWLYWRAAQLRPGHGES
jgi:uncharacterized membrane protein YgdD (TMEM256/DUF423 family)